MRALIVVDVQNDFVEGGSLPVRGGKRVAKKIYDYIRAKGYDYEYIVATHDWHIEPGAHFAKNLPPDFVNTWPVHCEANSEGAELTLPLSSVNFDQLVFKGQYAASFSGFDGRPSYLGVDSAPFLDELLKEHHITEVDVCGLAFDYCVKATAEGASLRGYETTVLTDMTAAVHNGRDEVIKVIKKLQEAGVNVI